MNNNFINNNEFVNFFLPLEPTDYILIGGEEHWKYITDRSVPGVDVGRYLISDFGRAYDLWKNRRCPEHDYSGYKSIGIHVSIPRPDYVSVLLHRIVALEFMEIDPNRHLVNHENGNKYCCLLDNLEWATESENINHAHRTGLNNNHSENATFAKITNEDALNIMYQLRDGVPIEIVIASVPKVIKNPTQLVNAILRGDAWKFLAEEHGLTFAEYKDRSNRYTEEEKERIGQLLEQNLDYKSILIQLGYNIDSMSIDELKAHNKSISQIRNGTASPYIAEKYNTKHKEQADFVFTIDQLHQACKIFQDGFISYDDTLTKMGYSPSSMTKEERFRYVNSLSALRRKRNFKDIASQYDF